MSIHNIMFSWRNKKNINTFRLKKKGFLSRAMSIAYIFSGEIRKKKNLSVYSSYLELWIQYSSCIQLLIRLFQLKSRYFSYFSTKNILWYGKCPKISFTKVSDKIACANSVDPDQMAPEGAI